MVLVARDKENAEPLIKFHENKRKISYMDYLIQKIKPSTTH